MDIDVDLLDLNDINETLKGNKEAYRGIVKRYQSPLLHMAINYLANEDDARDAVQEIFIKGFRALKTFKLGRRFSPWLYSIALNHLKSTYRSTKRREKIHILEKNTPPPPYDTPETENIKREDRGEILNALEKLPLKLREVVILYYFQEMDIGDIAKLLSIGRENVKSRLYRARGKLRTFLSS